jgi:hypothetical protein
MKYFYDTEFKEDGKTIDLISIGIVCYETGREYYAVSNEFDTRRVAGDWWLMQNVMNSIEHQSFVVTDFDGAPITRDIYVTDKNAKSRTEIAADVEAFVGNDKDAEFWAWYSAYDHVALAQLWGRMVDLPNRIPMMTCDIKQEHKRVGYPIMPKQPKGKHNALDDARFNIERYNWISKCEEYIGTLEKRPKNGWDSVAELCGV